MIVPDEALESVNAFVEKLQSDIFKGTIRPFVEKINESLSAEKIDDAQKEANKSVDKTIEELSEKQAEAIVFEDIFLNLVNDRINDARATEILTSLGYEINPNPWTWLKSKLSNLRQWIIEALP